MRLILDENVGERAGDEAIESGASVRRRVSPCAAVLTEPRPGMHSSDFWVKWKQPRIGGDKRTHCRSRIAGGVGCGHCRS